MGRELLMVSRGSYGVALGIVLISWFVPSTPFLNSNNDANDRPIWRAVPTSLDALGIAQLRPGGKCNLEYINGLRVTTDAKRINRSAQIRMTGWVIDEKASRIPEYVVTHLRNGDRKEYFFLSPVGFPRPDVLKYFKLPSNMISSGYALDLPTKYLPAGTYSITLILPFEDQGLECDNGRRITIY